MVRVDVGPREAGGQVRKRGPGRQLVQEHLEFLIGKGRTPTRLERRPSVQVVAVAHARRRPGSWRRRLS